MLWSYVVFGHILALVWGRGPHHPRGSHYSPKQGGPKLTKDQQLLQDVQHIQEDLGNVLTDEALKKMTPEELEFHYFKIHDFDNNTKLDGLEILQAIRHTIEHEHNQEKIKYQDLEDVADVGDSSTNTDLEEDFRYFVDLIDQVLAEDDTNKDGYLSYAEYVIGRQRDINKNSFISQ